MRNPICIVVLCRDVVCDLIIDWRELTLGHLSVCIIGMWTVNNVSCVMSFTSVSCTSVGISLLQ